jgi:glycosyltransferase involved in cell wall biosynthesis
MAVNSPMGQQVYETQIQAALTRAADPSRWVFSRLTMRSLRSPVPGDARYPAGLIANGPLWAAQAVGAVSYRGAQLVHRFDLRLPPASGPEVITVHDLPPLRFSDEGPIPRHAAASAQKARRVICPSGFAASEVKELLGADNIAVIPYGLAEAYREPDPIGQAGLQKLSLSRPYIVHAAGATARKNLASLAAAWAQVARQFPDLHLALCGPPDDRRTNLFRALPRVRLLGRLEPSVVASLMAGAAAVVVPSLYEGFGLPALEGMACGVPVVAANAGALPEVCAGAAHLVDPSPEGLAAGLLRVLTDEDLNTRLRRAGPLRASMFTWEKAARLHLEVYEQVVSA